VSSQQIFLLAAHAVMLSTGFLPVSQVADSLTAVHWRDCRQLAWRQEVALRLTQQPGTTASARPNSTAKSRSRVLQEEADAQLSAPPTSTAVLVYALASEASSGSSAAQPPNACVVKCTSLGAHTIIAGAAGAVVRQLVLVPGDHLADCVGAGTRGAAGDRFPARGSSANGAAGSFEGLQRVGVLAHARALWVRLADELAVPLLAALREAAGLPPLDGLLSLPTELKERCLAMLPVRDPLPSTQPTRGVCPVSGCCASRVHTGSQVKPIGYTWTCLACRAGYLVPIWQPWIESSCWPCRAACTWLQGQEHVPHDASGSVAAAGPKAVQRKK
jgi:hypothetical protein